MSLRLELPKSVTIVEVSPRDGLQSETQFIPTERKIALIDHLVAAGLSRIEATSFVSSKWVPQLADAEQVVDGITRHSERVAFQALILNEKGYERCRQTGRLRGVALVVAASETLNRRNANMTIDESMAQLTHIVRNAKSDGLEVRSTIGVAFICPYEGRIPIQRTIELAMRFRDAGCDEIALADTVGQARPDHVYELFSELGRVAVDCELAAHFHDTQGLALTNIFAAMQAGVVVFDSSVAGLGGCQFTKGASGNVATEAVVDMLSGMGIETGIDPTRLKAAAQFAHSLVCSPQDVAS